MIEGEAIANQGLTQSSSPQLASRSGDLAICLFGNLADSMESV